MVHELPWFLLAVVAMSLEDHVRISTQVRHHARPVISHIAAVSLVTNGQVDYRMSLSQVGIQGLKYSVQWCDICSCFEALRRSHNGPSARAFL